MSELRRRTRTGLWFGAVVLASAILPWQVLAVLVAVAGVIAVHELMGLRRAGVWAIALGVVALTGLVALLWLRMAGGLLIFVAILATWGADVAAYLVGSRIGRRKLAPRISPGKTWEGTIAGFIAAGAVVLAIGWLANAPDTLVPALVVGPVALAGDLLESWTKRRAQVKDSGTLFPGHGGMLDRIDSLVAVALALAVFYGPAL